MGTKVSAFKGLYYSQRHRSKLSELIVPAWNADELWGKKESSLSFRNVLVGTSEECGAAWKEWIDNGEFTEDDEEAIYILRHKFKFNSKSYTRWGAYVACTVEEGNFLTHEKIAQEGAENARERYATCSADLTPLFAGVAEICASKYRTLLEGAINDAKLLFECEEQPEAEHSLWKVTNDSIKRNIFGFLNEEQLYLLDGHHRWQAALLNKVKGNGDGRILAYVTSLSPEDLLILPIHRAMVKDEWLLPQNSIRDLEKCGCSVIAKLKWKPGVVEEQILKLSASEEQFYFLPVQSAELYVFTLPERSSEGQLVVERLEAVCKRIEGLHLVPVFGLPLLVEELASGQAQAAAFLPPMHPDQVRRVAESTGSLPRKSTRFFPKPALGIISRAWHV